MLFWGLLAALEDDFTVWSRALFGGLGALFGHVGFVTPVDTFICAWGGVGGVAAFARDRIIADIKRVIAARAQCDDAYGDNDGRT